MIVPRWPARLAMPVVLLAALALAATACGSSSSGPSGGPQAGDARTKRACGIDRRPPRRWSHVVWIVFENKSYDQIVGNGSDASYINFLASRCGLATRFHAEAHPSLPNYIAMTSGSTHGISDDSDPSSHQLSGPSIFSALGRNWRVLAEDMPSNCHTSNSGNYAVRHNPATYYTNVRSACRRQSVPLRSRPDISAKFTFIVPNLCSDMHSCPETGSDAGKQTRAGDAFLRRLMPKIFATRQYRAGRTAVFVTWDEDDYGGSNQIATIVVAPSVRRHTRSSRRFDHYSLLRTTQDMLGLRGRLGAAARAGSMRSAFNL
jgi:phosphatidylinositol-3-phosphatase